MAGSFCWRGKFQVDPKNGQPFIATGYPPQRPGVICDRPVSHVIAKGEGQKLPTIGRFQGTRAGSSSSMTVIVDGVLVVSF